MLLVCMILRLSLIPSVQTMNPSEREAVLFEYPSHMTTGESHG